MILCLDVGNSHIFGGVFEGDDLKLTFRKTSKQGASSDEYGLFFRSILRENGFDPEQVSHIALCSVVPEVVYSISNGCQKYLARSPFVLKAGTRTGLKIRYRNPLEVGADRIANAIAGTQMYPGEDLLILDLGTATTVDVISAGRDYLGGVIIPGLRMSMQALDQGTARLSSVEIQRVESTLGRSTADSIQSGLYHGHLGALKEIMSGLCQDAFEGERPRVLATGGFSGLFSGTGLYDEVIPDLVLRGLLTALRMNLD
ncbi:MAG: type III pantothenate kinase [Xanthomonadales bacterium]|nr:type III pantothenate kinase [Xanthomonadales bacterium]